MSENMVYKMLFISPRPQCVNFESDSYLTGIAAADNDLQHLSNMNVIVLKI